MSKRYKYHVTVHQFQDSQNTHHSPGLGTSKHFTSPLNFAPLRVVNWSLSGSSYMGQSHMVALLYSATFSLRA